MLISEGGFMDQDVWRSIVLNDEFQGMLMDGLNGDDSQHWKLESLRMMAENV